MKEDYLWDKTGEPDPEIQELEQLLGTLRYQPRPLDIPAGLAPKLERKFPSRLLAIAATIAIMLLGVGLWFGLQRDEPAKLAEVESNPAMKSGSPEAVAVQPNAESNPTPVMPSTSSKDKAIGHRVNPRSLVANRRTTPSEPKLTPQEREEAEVAKEQLMLALRVASSKLSFAQKKVREINSENLTHNQHKIG
jgi:hypothetical protein